MIRPLLALLVAAGLGACTSGRSGSEPSSARYASLDALATGSTAAPRGASPVATMPDWIGKPVRVRERADAESFEQAVSLSLSARGDTRGNLVLVTMRGSGTASLDAIPGEPPAPMAAPSEAGIRAELEAAFPGMAMAVVTRPAANAYGPYGLAVGRQPRGTRCLYAWQWIDDMRATGGAAWPEGPLSLRVRLCRDDITLEAMAAAVTKLRLVPPGQGAPVPVVAASSEARPAQASARPAPHRRHAAPEAVAELERPVRERRASAYPVFASSTAPVGVPGRRYLGAEASVSEPAAPAGLAETARAPSYGSPRTASAAPLTADLPPEAFRGPSGR